MNLSSETCATIKSLTKLELIDKLCEKMSSAKKYFKSLFTVLKTSWNQYWMLNAIQEDDNFVKNFKQICLIINVCDFLRFHVRQHLNSTDEFDNI